MSHCRTTLTDDICERTTPVISFQVVDGAGDGFQPEALTLTLYQAAKPSQQHRTTGPIINGRDQQNVLNANGITVDASGNVSWQLASDDTAIVADNKAEEPHIALFEWSWNGGTRHGKHEIEMTVKNLARVP